MSFNKDAEKVLVREFTHGAYGVQEWLIYVSTGEEVPFTLTRTDGSTIQQTIRKPKPALLWTRDFDTIVINGYRNPVFWHDGVTTDPFQFEACRRRCAEAFDAYWANPTKAE